MQNYNNCVLIAIIIKFSYSIVYFHSHDLTQRSVSCTKNMSVYGSFEKKTAMHGPHRFSLMVTARLYTVMPEMVAG